MNDIMKRNTIKGILSTLIIITIISIAFRWAGGEDLKYHIEKTSMIDYNSVLPEIVNGTTIKQEIFTDSDALQKINLTVSCYGRTTNKGSLMLKLMNNDTEAVLDSTVIDVSTIKSDQVITWNLDKTLWGIKDQKLILEATSNSDKGYGLSFYFLQDNSERDNKLLLNGETVEGVISYSLEGKSSYWFGDYYWYIVAGVLFLTVLGGLIGMVQERHNKMPISTKVYRTWEKYEFLIKQLVSRDFKTKYKRSILGYFWSLLNPLLSMIVQYIVFSTIFKQDIENFPVYLLSGIVMFNFFSDAVGQGLNSILCNASLITKVYVPKYIYPVTKVLSCSINLFISIIPLFVVMLITGEEFTKAIVLIVFPLLWVLIFSIGLALTLCAAMVFFRDTQYLWGIFSLIWTYATPLFYPARIIPPQYAFILKINPMYHYIDFLRTLLISGTSPGLSQYVICTFSAFLMLIIGIIVFKKTQDKFILYI